MDIEALIVKLQGEQKEIKEELAGIKDRVPMYKARRTGMIRGLQRVIDEAVKESDQGLLKRLKEQCAKWRKKEKSQKRPRIDYLRRAGHQGIVMGFEFAIDEIKNMEKGETR